jgi:RNA polymerase sigma-70 factor (ECF subfamily)
MPMETDQNIIQQLVRKCRQGDIKAQFSLYKHYSEVMYNIAIRLTNNGMDAEDILQESFITVFEKLGELQNDRAFGSWLKRIVVNNCISFLRKSKVYFEDITEQIPAGELEEIPLVEDTINPEEVHHAIKELPPGARTVLVMHALEGYKYREIADILDISESTCKTQYKRALGLLNKKFKNPAHVN